MAELENYFFPTVSYSEVARLLRNALLRKESGVSNAKNLVKRIYRVGLE
jgi:hypothetical protein